jgi:hypothetical protein
MVAASVSRPAEFMLETAESAASRGDEEDAEDDADDEREGAFVAARETRTFQGRVSVLEEPSDSRVE